ncbi:CinA family protein [Intrasporangium calvum]|uniref:Competence/damage-inducible protein cinA n=1 Tax=Intrasporangium calvum (strain ATCC 23552 / DSM 43043 / JCM 3097 / NBRC 12989 / NCIMB 10167 / NRRL B-3866 / 7 KIP) TaxID=710696 RepID=E6SDN1_INTC7|nr:nicotinamide-nucleotide amidohydrolase family protein [Intrasporangium calvum]ADU48683.1 competence/damage-inducible protein cinA [Intrasporangium calvum DSM 43043]
MTVPPVAAHVGADSDSGTLSARLVAHLTAAGETIAAAESLTAGLVAATVADTPGASLVLRGAVVAYAADLKVELLGVPGSLVDEAGTVDPRVARAMAEGVRDRLGATWGVSTTGVAGPGPAEGKPAGTVHVAVAGPAGTVTRALRLNGGRPQVRAAATEAALTLALDVMTGNAKPLRPPESHGVR